MPIYKEQHISNELKKMIGPNFEPTKELEKMLMMAYFKGREDVMESLGLDENELSLDAPLMAWTA